MTKRIIKNEKDFESLMREIDSILHQQDVSIHARELKALSEATKILSVELVAAPLNTGPIPGVYEGESLSAHIYKWIRNRYGDRLKVDFSNGYSVILLKGDPWLFRFPVIYGEVTGTCERDLAKKFPSMVVMKPGEARKKPILNLLLCLENLPQGLADELSDSDLRAILNFFQFGHEFLNALNSFCRDDQLAMSGLSDLNASARYCVAGASEHGLSRWASFSGFTNLSSIAHSDLGCWVYEKAKPSTPRPEH